MHVSKRHKFSYLVLDLDVELHPSRVPFRPDASGCKKPRMTTGTLNQSQRRRHDADATKVCGAEWTRSLTSEEASYISGARVCQR